MFIFVNAQGDYKAGFEMLEKGDFEAATQFFEKAVEKYPEDKTANLCYGRAVGLYNNPLKAEKIFEDLLGKFPNDYELELNLAESYMWQKQFASADSLYAYLVEKDTTNFVARLGLANATTSLKKHQTAVAAIEKALEISPGNPSALVSKKYIYLAYADDFRSQQNYSLAHQNLDKIDALFPLDKDILLTKAVVFLNQQKPRSAQKIYDKLIANDIALVQAYNGKSYCNTLLQQSAEGLKYASLSVENIDSETDKNIAFDAKLNRLNTLALNSNFSEARKYLAELSIENPEDLRFQLASARLDMWQWNYKDAEEKYRNLLEKDSDETAILIEYADALRGINKRKEAITILEQATQQDSTLLDVEKNLQYLKYQQKAHFTTKNNYSTDAGGNRSFDSKNNLYLVHSDKHQTLVGVNLRSAWNTPTEGITQTTANTATFWLGQMWQPHFRLKLSAKIGVLSATALENQRKNSLQFYGDAKYAISKWQQAEFSYARAQFNYNADLIFSQIGTNDFTFTHHIYSPWKVGLYSQYIFTTQSDDNQRNLLYASLYYNLLQVPILKIGLNFNWFQYKTQKPELYFSPEKFSALSFFVQFHNLDKQHDKFRYHFMGAVGSQQIENNDRQATQLLDIKLGYDFSNRFLIMAHYMYSSAAQENITGFSFNQIGLQGRFIF